MSAASEREGGRGSRSGFGRVSACASVISLQRFRQPSAFSTRSVRGLQTGDRNRQSSDDRSPSWLPEDVRKYVISAPMIGRTPNAVQACANSIAPQSPSWSVIASAS